MNGVAQVVEDAMDDDRLYMMELAASEPSIGMDPDAGVLYDLLTDEAERIERTTGALTTVSKEPSPAGGPSTGFYSIRLFAILPRDIDAELFDRVVDTARHRALNAAHQIKEGADE